MKGATMNKTCFCGIAEHCGYQIETDMEQHDKVIYENDYNKAIYDCLKILKDNVEYIETDEEDYRTIDIGAILLIEQLKGGGKDE